MTTEEKIKSQIADNQILLYMKGSPEQPQCGFSQRATQILMACGKEFSFVDILSNPEIRETLPNVSNWPTCLLYTSPSPRDSSPSRMPSSA